MESKWRPKDWQNPFKDSLREFGYGKELGFEVGADKMLEALTKQGVRAGFALFMGGRVKAVAKDGNCCFLEDLAATLLNQMKGKDGWLVFIPKG